MQGEPLTKGTNSRAGKTGGLRDFRGLERVADAHSGFHCRSKGKRFCPPSRGTSQRGRCKTDRIGRSRVVCMLQHSGSTRAVVALVTDDALRREDDRYLGDDVVLGIGGQSRFGECAASSEPAEKYFASDSVRYRSRLSVFG